MIVEGATEGGDRNDKTWTGGGTLAWRLCSVFDFTEEGLIERMYIYLAPDYTSLDRDRFHRRRSEPRW